MPEKNPEDSISNAIIIVIFLLIFFVMGIALMFTTNILGDDVKTTFTRVPSQETFLRQVNVSYTTNNAIDVPGVVDVLETTWLNFDGLDSFVSVGTRNNNTDFLQNNMSVSFWFYLNNESSDFSQPILIDKLTSTEGGWNIKWVNSTKRIRFTQQSRNLTFFIFEEACCTANNTWNHYVFEFESSKGVNMTTSYKNGVFSNQSNASAMDIIGNNSQAFRFGGESNTNTINGSLDKIVLYNRSVSTTDALTLFNAGRTRNTSVNMNASVAWWPFDEDTGTTTYDLIGFINGTLTNGGAYQNNGINVTLNSDDYLITYPNQVVIRNGFYSWIEAHIQYSTYSNTQSLQAVNSISDNSSQGITNFSQSIPTAFQVLGVVFILSIVGLIIYGVYRIKNLNIGSL